MIQLKELTLGYGQRILLDKVSARITGGQLVALLGRNGTGKSTLLRAIMGLEKPQTGEIVLQGKNIASLKPEKLARNISFVTTDKVRIAICVAKMSLHWDALPTPTGSGNCNRQTRSA